MRRIVTCRLPDGPTPVKGFVPLGQVWEVCALPKYRGDKWAVYALCDPRDEAVRYVGVTRGDLSKRLQFHVKDPTNAGMAQWLRHLASVKVYPKITALEYVDFRDWEDAERGWIHWFRQRGRLLNVDPGGKYRDKRGRKLPITLGKFQEPVKNS